MRAAQDPLGRQGRRTAPRGLKRMVLVVDDDEIDRTRVHRWLGDRFALCEAATGQGGLHMIEQLEPACVILDFYLPDYDAFELMGELVRRRIPVVVTTGRGDEHLAAESVKRGAQDYIPKRGMTREILEGAVERAIGRRALLEALAEARENLDDVLSTTSVALEPRIRAAREGVSALSQTSDGFTREQVASLEAIGQGVGQLEDCVAQLVRFAHAGNLHEAHDRVDLREVAAGLQEHLSETITSSDARLDLHDLPLVHGSRSALTQLLSTLVRAGIEDPGHGPPVLRARSRLDCDRWHVRIEDDRRPFPDELCELLFRPLFLPESVGSLAGLELATCARIVRLHGGELRYEPVKPSGRAFLFSLPARLQG